MSAKKKVGEITFKEFFDLAEDEPTRQSFLRTLKQEGFTEKQINEMKMEKAWKFFIDSQSPLFDELFASFGHLLETKPEVALAFHPILEKLRESLEKLVKELEEEEKRRKENSS